MIDLNYLGYYLNEIPYTLLWAYYYHYMLPKKNPKKGDFSVLAFSLLAMTAFQVVIFPIPGAANDQPFLRTSLAWILYTSTLLIVRKAGIKRTSYVFLIHMLTSITVEVLAMLTLRIVLQLIHQPAYTGLNMHSAVFFINDFYTLIAYRLLVHHRKSDFWKDNSDYYLVLIILAASQFYWLYIIPHKLIYGKFPDPLFFGIGIVILILCYSSTALILRQIVKAKKKRKELEMEQQVSNEIHQHFHELSEKQNTLEEIYQELVNLPAYEKQYLESMRDRLFKIRNRIYCDDVAVNAMLNYFKQQCEQEGIRFEIQIEAALENTLESYDLNTLLSNILKNAVEACEDVADAWIRLSISKKGGLLMVRCSNANRVEKKENVKRLSGQGMPIIREIVKKYHGDMKLVHSEDQRMVQMVIEAKLIN